MKTPRLKVMDRVAVLDRTNFYAPGEIGKTRRLTPEGFMVCEGVAIARTGEQRYHKTELPLDPDGAGEITVTRTPEEVFRADTIASFEGKSVTLEHPNDFLTPDSWKDHEVGTAHNVRRGTGIEDDLLLADLLIKDGEAIAFINKKRPEVSSGYDAEYEQTGPGRATQHNILANHIALLVGRGRAGSRCAVRDSEWEAAVRDAFDPKEPRDESGKWTALAKTAERHAHAAGGDKFVIERSANARHATEEAMASGEPRLHDKAAFSHNVAISFHEEQAKKKSTTPAARASHQQAISAHTSVMQMHRKQSGETYAAPPLPLGKSPRVKKHSYYKAAKDSRSTHGDKSMKSRFADKFIRVMQAFSAKDAVALDRELATEDHSTEDSDTATDARINDALHWIDAQRAAARDAEEAAAKKEEDCDMEEKKKAKDAQAAKDSAAALEAARAARDVGVLNTTDASQVFKHVMARAEILFPGIQVPTGDSATAKDAIPQLMLRTVKAAYATDTGKAVIDPFLLGEAIEAVTVDNVSGVFTGAAELMRQRNNQAGSNTKLSVKDFGSKTITPKTLEQMNRDFWDKRTSA